MLLGPFQLVVGGLCFATRAVSVLENRKLVIGKDTRRKTDAGDSTNKVC